MSFNVGDLFATLRADTKQFDAGMAKAEQSFQKVGAAAAKVDTGVKRATGTTSAYGQAQRLSTGELDRATAAWNTQFGVVDKGMARRTQIMGRAQAAALRIDTEMSDSAARAASATAAARLSMARADQVWIRSQGLMHAQALRMNAVFDAGAVVSTRSVAGLGRMSGVLASLSSRMLGVSPIFGSLVRQMGSFAIGGVMITAVLGGLAAVAAAWRLIGKDAREAREEQKKLADQLAQMAAEEHDPGGLRGLTRDVSAEIRRVEQERDAKRAAAALLAGAPVGGHGAAERIQKNIDALNKQAAAYDAQLLVLREQQRIVKAQSDALTAKADAETEAIKRLNEQLAETMYHLNRIFERAKHLFDIPGGDIGGAGRLLDQDITRSPRLGGGTSTFLASSADRFRVGGVDRSDEARDRISKMALRFQANFTTQLKELELTQRRKQAYQSLAQALVNVGHAYGNVIGQITALVGATLSLERMPMAKKGEKGYYTDRGAAYGSAALAGAGYGKSSGSPAIGALGGAISGFSMAGAPGALVGGVTGIVSGLLEQGARAREAARVWSSAFDDFADMFDVKSPLEQNIERLNDAFEALTGGNTAEEVRALVSGMSPSNLNWFGLTKWKDLLAEYDKNFQQASDAAGELGDELSGLSGTVHNAPSGYRVDFARYSAETPTAGGGAPDNSITVEGDVVIMTDDPDRFGEQIRRQARRGGTTPLQLATVPTGSFVAGGV